MEDIVGLSQPFWKGKMVHCQTFQVSACQHRVLNTSFVDLHLLTAPLAQYVRSDLL